MGTEHPIPTNKRFISLIGKLPFGQWQVLSYAGTRGPTHYWNCRCSCGVEKEVAGESLKRGLSTCCRTCARRVPMVPQVKHGMIQTITYSSWKAMNQRCHNPRSIRYKDYGGRGITVCPRWRNSFVDFLADMGERPSADHSIDRFPNNNGHYEPGNCRWATRHEQTANMRSNHFITHEGATLHVTEWSRCKSLNVATIRARLRLGWTDSAALDTPSNLKYSHRRKRTC